MTGLVVVAALVAGVSTWYQGNPRPGGPAATSPAPAAGTETVPNGCLAGPLNDTDGLLQAQSDAPHNQTGAISLGAAILRWTAQYPRPSAKDGTTVAGSVLARGATGTIADMALTMSSPKTYPGVTSGSLNFANGRYMVEEATPDMVRFTAGGEVIQNGKPAGLKFASTLTMVWEGELWKVRNDATERTTDDLFANGSAFAGGC